MEKTSKIYVAGHRGLVGSAIVRALTAQGFTNLLTRTSKELDLTNQAAVTEFFTTEKPEYVFLAAAKVGGIMDNKNHPANFIYENLAIQGNVINSSYVTGVKKLLFLGSSCIYPKLAPQPISEDALLTSELEPSNEAYAIAKIAGLKMCQAYNSQYKTKFISVMPTNLYGPNDNWDPETSHVLPAMMRRFHEAKQNNIDTVTLWGTGSPMREFLYVDDLADACLHLMQTYDGNEILNIGTGTDITIKELAETVKNVVGYKGSILWDTSKPDGTPRKLLNVSKIHALGWSHQVELYDGINFTYQWFTDNISNND